ncbi:MAG: MFS transporter [Clostridiales bacterium]|nr:MFS transporter [Clostridiales bacterium]
MFAIESDSRLNRRFSALQASFFAAYAGTSFFSYILLKNNIPNAYIGFFGAMTYFSSTLAQPVWGNLCDRYGCHRVFYWISAVVTPILYIWIVRLTSLPALVVCSLISGMFVNCIQNMGNGWVSSLNAEGHQINYGISRSCGSLAFAVMAVVLGWAIQLWDYAGLIGGMALCGLLCIAVSLTIPRSKGVKRQPGEERDSSLSEGLRILLAQKEYVAVVVGGFLAMTGVAGVSTYFSAYLAILGAGAAVVGLGNFTYAIAEAPFMFLFRRLVARFTFRRLFAASLFAHGLQCLLVGISPNYTYAILSMLMQGLSFGTLVPCLQYYTAEHIDRDHMSTAQLFTSAVSLSASIICGSLLAGVLSHYFTLPVTFLLLSMISFGGFLLYMLYTARGREKRDMQADILGEEVQ